MNYRNSKLFFFRSMSLKIKYVSRQKLRLWQKCNCGADCISDYFSKLQDYWITQVGDDLDDLIQPLLKAGCTLRPGLCPVDFEKLPQMETPHLPHVLCRSASLFHCENSKSFMQEPFQINSILVTQAPEVWSIRNGFSSLFLLLPKLSPERLK